MLGNHFIYIQYDSFRLIHPEISLPTSWILMKFIGDPNISQLGELNARPGRQTLGRRKEPGRWFRNRNVIIIIIIYHDRFVDFVVVSVHH